MGFIALAIFAFYAKNGIDPVANQTLLDHDADKIFPFFVLNELPAGLPGLLVAGVLGSTMSVFSGGLNASASDIDDSPSSFFVNSKSTDGGALAPLRRRGGGSEVPPSVVLSGSAASCTSFMLTCGLHIPMTHHNDAGHLVVCRHHRECAWQRSSFTTSREAYQDHHLHCGHGLDCACVCGRQTGQPCVRKVNVCELEKTLVVVPPPSFMPGVGAPHQCPLEGCACYLMEFYADVCNPDDVILNNEDKSLSHSWG